MPQVPTARGIKIRSASDAHLLFYAVHLQRLPIIQRRLDATERLEVTSGAVFVWEERSASTTPGAKLEPDAGPAAGVISGIERWTDGLKWGPSRVRDDFLFYQEKDPSGDTSLSPQPLSHNHPYRKGQARQPELLVKQTYSVHYNPQVLDGKPPVEPARKWHLTAYQSAGSADLLANVGSVHELQDLVPPEGLFRKARIGKKREGPGGAQSGPGTTPTMGSSMYPLEPYGSVHNGMSGMGHGHRNGGHSASGSYDVGVDRGREGSMASSSWREGSVGEMGIPHRPLLPHHASHGIGQNGYSPRNGMPSSSSYPPSHNGHVPPSNGYHGAHYTPQSHYAPSHGHTHSASHHSHSGSIGYGEPNSPYAQAHHNAGQIHGGGYVGGVPSGYPSYPQREVGYGHPSEGDYNRAPGAESPSMAHATPGMNGHLSNPPQHSQGLHHPHPSANGQNTYDAYHPSTSTSQHHHHQQQHSLDQNPHHHNGAPIQPPQDAAMGQVRQAHHSYSYSNGHPLPGSPHLHQNTPHLQHVNAESRPYPLTPQQRPIMPHPHSQNPSLDHRRTFSQTSHPVAGPLDGMRSPPVGVARIRKGTRKSEDITGFQPIMSRSPPSNHAMNGASPSRPNGTGAIGGNGGRSQFSPYSRPVDAPGPRQHMGIAPHHQSETGSTLPSFEHPYNSRATNGSFQHQDQEAPIHMRAPSNSHPFATPSVPSVPAPPDLHHYPPPVPPSLPPRGGVPQGPPPNTGYYFSAGPVSNGGGITAGGPSPFGPPDYSRSNSSGTWPDGSATTLRSTPLQTHSAYPFPAGTLPTPQNPSQHHSADVSGDPIVGIPAVPIGTTMQGHIAPHPNPNSSPLLTHFQPMSTSLGSTRSGTGSGGSGGMHGSPELAGLHRHMAAAVTLAGGWDGGTARGGTPAPPRIDTSLGGVDSSPLSVTAGGSASGSASSKLGPLTPSTTLVTRDPEDERVLDLLSRGPQGAGVRGGGEGNAGGPTEENTNPKADE